MSDEPKKPTHVESRHGAKRHLPVLGALSMPADFAFTNGVPPKREDCAQGARPCRYILCRHHMWLVLQEDRPGNPATGSQGETTIRPIGESCNLDIGRSGVHTNEEVGRALGVTSTRANQIELRALRKMRAAGVTAEAFAALIDDSRDAA